MLSIHVAYSSWKWFLDNGVHVVEQPALSPDLNPQENVWRILSMAVYANGRQFQSKEEMKSAIIENWDNTDPFVFKRLVDSMPHRVSKVIYKHGVYVGY